MVGLVCGFTRTREGDGVVLVRFFAGLMDGGMAPISG